MTTRESIDDYKESILSSIKEFEGTSLGDAMKALYSFCNDFTLTEKAELRIFCALFSVCEYCSTRT